MPKKKEKRCGLLNDLYVCTVASEVYMFLRELLLFFSAPMETKRARSRRANTSV